MIRPRLTDRAKIEAIAMKKRGCSYSEIAETLGTSKSTIHNIIQRFEETGNVKERARSGRPKISTPTDDRILVRIAKKNRRLPSHQLAKQWNLSSGLTASPSLVRKRLVSAKMEWKAAVRKPRLSRNQKLPRKKWCSHLNKWNFDTWKRVIFSDEMNIEVDSRKNKVYLRRMPHEKYNDDCILKRTKQGSGSIGIWACMGYNGVGCFKIFEGRLNRWRYIDILEDCLLPSIDLLLESDQQPIFQQDGAPCHTAGECFDWFKDFNIIPLQWPANSPDLNPIENLWSWLDMQISKHEPRNEEQLIEIVTNQLNNVPIDICKNLFKSMPNRIKECIKNNGGITSY